MFAILDPAQGVVGTAVVDDQDLDGAGGSRLVADRSMEAIEVFLLIDAGNDCGVREHAQINLSVQVVGVFPLTISKGRL
jgi:hypothetical protein